MSALQLCGCCFAPKRPGCKRGDLVGSRVSGQLPAVAQVRVEKGFRGYIGVILGLYRDFIGVFSG